MTTQALRLAFVLWAALVGATIHPASAQTCPDRTIHLIVGYAPGGSGGAAAQEVAKAAPDGCTLLVGHTAEIAVNPAISRNLGYDPARDLQPLALLARPVGGPFCVEGCTTRVGDRIEPRCERRPWAAGHQDGAPRKWGSGGPNESDSVHGLRGGGDPAIRHADRHGILRVLPVVGLWAVFRARRGD